MISRRAAVPKFGGLSARLLLSSAALLCALRVRAQDEAPEDPSGTYKATARDVRVDVSTWGPDCGPRPKNVTEPAIGQVEVTRSGQNLSLKFIDRTLRSDGCWSPNPAVRVTNKLALPTRWRTECRTVEGDAKKERGVYILTASPGNVIELLEEHEYDWQLNKSHCVAKMRATQMLRRASAAPQPTPAPDLEAEGEPAPSGCKPGAAARIRLRPKTARIGPDERVCFTVRVSDADGCVISSAGSDLKWSLTKPTGASGAISGSCFKAAPRAAEAEGRFQIAVAIGSLRAEAVIDVVPADLSDITARRGLGTASDLEGDERPGIARELGIEAVVRDSSENLLIAIAIGVMMLLAGLALVLYARAKAAITTRPATAGGPALAGPRPSVEPRVGATSVSLSPPTPTPPGEAWICPQCRQGYPAGTERCAKDGTRPIPYGEFLRHAQAQAAQVATCPSCRAQLAPDALFCGECGTKVRP